MNPKDAFDRFAGTTALVVGDVMLDAYLWGRVERISPEAPVPVVHVTERSERLGGAANVALNMRSLGANPVVVSVIGNEMPCRPAGTPVHGPWPFDPRSTAKPPAPHHREDAHHQRSPASCVWTKNRRRT
ncbi:MAG: hypothetical protein IPN38_00540 [Flavobacteriales bacterium]|nr:hypothetical protein [Flavobacteriales bacterium]